MPDSLQYIMLMAACLILTFPLEFFFKARVYRRPLHFLQVLLVTAMVFSIWDVIAIHAGLWTYSGRFVSEILLPFGLPLEELLFFITIPVCAILTYESVGTVLRSIRRRRTSTGARHRSDSDA